jgi:hypothetical protein
VQKLAIASQILPNSYPVMEVKPRTASQNSGCVSLWHFLLLCIELNTRMDHKLSRLVVVLQLVCAMCNEKSFWCNDIAMCPA